MMHDDYCQAPEDFYRNPWQMPKLPSQIPYADQLENMKLFQELQHLKKMTTAEAKEMFLDERKTDPTTGGQKNVKLARYDLLPVEPFRKIAEAYQVEQCPLQDLISIAAEWWLYRGTQEDLVFLGARILKQACKEYELDLNEPLFAGIPISLVEWLANTYGHGASKYSDDNWRQGYKWSLSWAAMVRHLREATKWPRCKDEESRQPHLAHALWHVLTLLEWYDTHPELDDRK